MKSRVTFTALAVLVFAQCLCSHAENLLGNGGFEEPIYVEGQSGNKGYSAHCWYSVFPTATMNAVYESLYSGSQYQNRGPVHIRTGNDAIRFTSFTSSPTEGILYQDVSVVPGRTYSASVWVYLWDNVAGNWASSPSNFAGMGVQELSSTKVLIVDHTETRRSTGTNGWYQLTQQVTTGAQTRFIRFRLHVNYNFDYMHGHAQFDDAVLDGTPPNSGDWLQFRGNGKLTGRFPARGKWSAAPTLKWSKYVGARETLLGYAVVGAGAPTTNLPTADSGDYYGTQKTWGLTAPEYDLDGTGTMTPIGPSSQYKIGKFTAAQGTQKVLLDGGVPSTDMYGHLYNRSGGAWIEGWKTEYIPIQYAADVLVDDVDGDSQLEVVHQAWYDMYVRRMSDGTNKYAKCHAMPDNPTPESGRLYGWFGAFDLNNDERKEFVTLAFAENHVSVVGWKYANGAWSLERKWYAFIEQGCVDKKTIHQPITDGVQDVDGDGYREVVTNVYNWDPYTQQQDAPANPAHWRVVIFDGMTGQVKGELVDSYLNGIVDFDGDGSADLFITKTSPNSTAIPDGNRVEVWSFRNQSWSQRFVRVGAAFQMGNLPDLPLNVNSCATKTFWAMVQGQVRTGGKPVFVTREMTEPAAGTVKLTLWQADTSGNPVPISVIQGPNLEVLKIKPASGSTPSVLVKASVMGGDSAPVTATGVVTAPPVYASRKGGIDVLPVTVGRLNRTDTKSTVVVQGGCERLVAFEASSSATTKWSTPGRGMQTGSSLAGPYLNGGLLLADVDGDGQLETVTAVKAPSGCARLVAMRVNGAELWHHDFDDIPGDTPQFAVGGLLQWFAGHFRSADNYDILVDCRQSMDSEIRLIDGRTGAQVARRTQGGWTDRWVTPGGWWWAIFDHDGDGLDDALLMNRGTIIVVKGNDFAGNLLLNKCAECTTGIFLGFGTPPGSYPGCPVVDNWLTGGQRAMLYGSCTKALAVLRMDGTPQWVIGSATENLPYMLPCLGDINGDGVMEMLSDGRKLWADHYDWHNFEVYNSNTGALQSSLKFTGCYNSCGPAVCDLDGDGRDEFITVWDNRMFIIGTTTPGGLPVVKWTINSPSGGALGSPAVVDVSGSGDLYVIVACNDGNIYAYGCQAMEGPIGTVTINSGDTYTTSQSVSLTLSATTTTAYVSLMRFSNDGTTWQPWTSFNSTKSWTLSAGDGLKTVYVQFMDSHANSSASFADTIALGNPVPIAQAHGVSTGSPVVVSGGVVTAAFADGAYVEDPVQLAAIKVVGATGLSIGDLVDVAGLVGVSGCEKVIQSTVYRVTGTGQVKPVAMTNRSTGGSDWYYDADSGSGVQGITGARGLNNLGLLVRVWGRVQSTYAASFTADDGSGVDLMIQLPAGMSAPAVGAFVVVDGISSCQQSALQIHRLIRPRALADVAVVVQ